MSHIGLCVYAAVYKNPGAVNSMRLFLRLKLKSGCSSSGGMCMAAEQAYLLFTDRIWYIQY